MDLTNKAEELIAMLHVIAAGEDSENSQKGAVQQVFTRLVKESSEAIGGDLKKIRRWMTSLQSQLKAPSQVSRSGRFAILRDHAQELVSDWLQRNADHSA